MEDSTYKSRRLVNDLEDAVHRLATFQAIDKLMPHDAPEALIDELRKELVTVRREVHRLRGEVEAALDSAAHEVDVSKEVL